MATGILSITTKHVKAQWWRRGGAVMAHWWRSDGAVVAQSGNSCTKRVLYSMCFQLWLQYVDKQRDGIDKKSDKMHLQSGFG